MTLESNETVRPARNNSNLLSRFAPVILGLCLLCLVLFAIGVYVIGHNPFTVVTNNVDRITGSSAKVSDKITLNPGQEATVRAGGKVSGDIQVYDATTDQWIALYDSKQETGLVTSFTEESRIRAEWGAHLSYIMTADDMASYMTTVDGCGTLCETVIHKTWPQ